jgi:hypothetical protein
VVREAVGTFCGVLRTEGYSVYERLTQKTTVILHAHWWSHTRRQFEKAQGAEPRLVAAALERSAKLYNEEAKIRELGLEGVAKLAHRGAYTKPRGDACLAWLKQTGMMAVLLPANPFGQAAR